MWGALFFKTGRQDEAIPCEGDYAATTDAVEQINEIKENRNRAHTFLLQEYSHLQQRTAEEREHGAKVLKIAGGAAYMTVAIALVIFSVATSYINNLHAVSNQSHYSKSDNAIVSLVDDLIALIVPPANLTPSNEHANSQKTRNDDYNRQSQKPTGGPLYSLTLSLKVIMAVIILSGVVIQWTGIASLLAIRHRYIITCRRMLCIRQILFADCSNLLEGKELLKFYHPLPQDEQQNLRFFRYTSSSTIALGFLSLLASCLLAGFAWWMCAAIFVTDWKAFEKLVIILCSSGAALFFYAHMHLCKWLLNGLEKKNELRKLEPIPK